MPELEQVPWEPSAERQELAAAIRALLDTVVRTGADPAELADAARVIDDLRERLGAKEFARSLEISIDAPRAHMSLVGGLSHPFAPQLHMTRTENGCEGTIVVPPAFEGGPGLVHGGIISLLFDHAMAYAAALTSGPVMTGTLSITYRRPTPLAVPLTVAAAVDRIDGRKIYISSTITVAGEATVEASALFIQLTRDNIATVYGVAG